MIPKNPYSTPRWRRLRLEVLDRFNGLCQECHRQGYSADGNTIHHIKPWKDGATPSEREALLWDIDNLEPVCGSCHTKLHNDLRPQNKEADALDALAVEYLGLNKIGG